MSDRQEHYAKWDSLKTVADSQAKENCDLFAVIINYAVFFFFPFWWTFQVVLGVKEISVTTSK